MQNVSIATKNHLKVINQEKKIAKTRKLHSWKNTHVKSVFRLVFTSDEVVVRVVIGRAE